jgi:hypothetical protein
MAQSDSRKATKMLIHNTYLGGDEDLAARGAHLHMA